MFSTIIEFFCDLGKILSENPAGNNVSLSIINVNINKKDISKTCGISEVTISKCYKELLKYHKYIIPPEVKEKLYGKDV